MTKVAINHSSLRLKKRTSNKRVIDLVSLAKLSMGDEKLEIELLNRFSLASKSCFERLRESSNQAEMNANLDILLCAANGVGANALIAFIVDARAKSGVNENENQEMIADIGFLIEESQEFIEQISQ